MYIRYNKVRNITIVYNFSDCRQIKKHYFSSRQSPISVTLSNTIKQQNKIKKITLKIRKNAGKSKTTYLQ